MISLSDRISSCIVFAALLNISGCATIVSGKTDKVSIDSIPSGASVTIDSIDRGQTPLDIRLDRGASHTIVFKKTGYEDCTVITTNTLNGWVFGNILLGGLIGLAVDASTDSTDNISPNPIKQALTASSPKPPAAEEGTPGDNATPIPKWMAPSQNEKP